MSDWPGYDPALAPALQYGSLGQPMGLTAQALTALSGGQGTAAVEVANTAHLYPVYLDSGFVCARMGLLNGPTVSGNFDLGIYDARGTRLGSTGSTAQAGTSSFQTVSLTASVTLKPRILYYLALAANGTTGTFTCNLTSANFPLTMDFFGMRQAASSFPLPSSLTPATATYKRSPVLQLSERTVF